MFDKPKHMDDGSIYLQMKKLTSPHLRSRHSLFHQQVPRS